jgi:hypothetical protein
MIDKKLEMLSQIESVEAPPFLLTRIKQKIENQSENHVSMPFTWSLIAAVSLLFILNCSVLFLNDTPKQTTNLVETLELMPKNDFYK